MEKYNTRPITGSDAPQLRELLNVLNQPDAEEFAERWVGNWPLERDRGTFALDEDGQGCGAAWFRQLNHQGERPGEIPEVIVVIRPNHQRRGLGRALLAEVVAQAREIGFSALAAVIRPDNAGARRLLKDYRTSVRETRSDAETYLIVLRDIHGLS